MLFIDDRIADKRLLNHPFYQKWSEGALSRETLQQYAQQYYHHVLNFPCCLSALHSHSNIVEDRQVLLENLVDEDQGEDNHPKLWRDFAANLDVTFDQEIPLHPATRVLVDTFLTTCRTSYAEGLGALYAHEYQYHLISESKKEGLIKHFGITDEKALKFFTVHGVVDIWHTEQLMKLIARQPDQEAIVKGAEKGAAALWGFLDGMMDYVDTQH